MSRILLLLALLCIASSSSAQTPVIPFPGENTATLPKRIALVIGVARYSGSSAVNLIPLPGTRTDASNVADVLTSAGFEVTRLIDDGSPSGWIKRDTINHAINDLIIDVQNARVQTGRGAIVAFYFAGHGLRSNGKNYLLPSDFTANFIEDVPTNAVELESQIANGFGAADIMPELKIIIVDACRTAAPASLRSRTGGPLFELRRETRDPSFDGANFALGKNHTYFLFASLPDGAAFDGDGGGQFTTRLVDVMRQYYHEVQQHPDPARGTSLQNMFQDIKTDMMAAPIKRQIPQHDDRFASPFYPFPTKQDFILERDSFIGVDQVPIERFRNLEEGLNYQACEFMKMLKNFSQYSYFSPTVIKKIQRRYDDPSLSCSRIALRPSGGATRSGDNRWNPVSPQDSDPARTPTDTGGPSQSPGGRSGVLEYQRLSPGKRIRVAQASNTSPLMPAPTTSEGSMSPAAITFGDLKALISSFSGIEGPGLLPQDDVPLNRAVVTKSDSNLRRAPGVGQPVVSSVAQGEFLEVIRTSKGRTWLEVRHPRAGQAYISGDLVEPALLEITKTVPFEASEFRPTEASLIELTTAFGLLGGVAIVEAAVEYPPADAKFGFARAAAVRTFVESVLPRPEKSRVYVHLRENSTSKLEPNKVLVRLIGLPLNRSVRTSIAQMVKENSRVELDVQLPSDLQTLPTASATVCTANNECKDLPTVTDREDIKKAIEDVRKVQPATKGPGGELDLIRNNLKLFRF
jgi:Caspase domain